jgi:hypothetical protein
MVTRATGTVLNGIPRVLAIAAFAVFMGTAFRTGWTQPSTDFPNYYTAAVLVRQHKPLRNYYDWTWFARQMNYAGFETQLGAYTPQTPVTMLPMVALAGLPAQDAKRAWLAVNLVLLAVTLGMLARVTGIRWELIAILLFCGFRSIETNFVYGQYYIFLLFLITLTFYWFDRSLAGASGFLSGVAFGLKLYTGPLLFYFAAKRKWRSVAGMLTAAACLGVLAVAMFGWNDIRYYLMHVLPRTLEGGSIDPYNPGVPTISTLLRRLFVREPGLNPSPALDAPWLFFFGRTAVQLGLIAVTTLGVAAARTSNHHRDFAWFVIALVLLSTSTASYTFVLLLVPTALLLKDASPWKSAYLVASYILLNANLQPAWLFPKVWLLLLLFAVAGAGYWSRIPATWAICAVVAILLASWADARRHMLDYVKEPGRRYQEIAVERQDLFAGHPTVSQSGLFYQGMGDAQRGQGYVLRWKHDGRIEGFAFEGHVLDPVAAPGENSVWFELVAHGISTTMRFDPLTRRALPAPLPDGSRTGDSVTSPDGRWTAFTQTTVASDHLWIRNLATGQEEELASGSCNSSSPAWELDSSAVVFASDCGRAFGLPALYRAEIAQHTAREEENVKPFLDGKQIVKTIVTRDKLVNFVAK